MRARRLVLAALGAALVALSAGAAPAAAIPEFRADCLFSHRANDDPIVMPGHPGVFHRHEFFGNRTTNAHSTAASLARGRTSCEPNADRSAYWVPTLYKDRRVVTAGRFTVYYFAEERLAKRVRPFPHGFKLVAGNRESDRRPRTGSKALWSCEGAPVPASPSMVTCPPGSRLEMILNFPDCWDGRRLDSPDHRRHAAYSAAGRCPASHPVPIPKVQFKIAYPTRGGSGVMLASGKPHTAHGDFFNAWKPVALQRRVDRCLKPMIKCDTYGLPE